MFVEPYHETPTGSRSQPALFDLNADPHQHGQRLEPSQLCRNRNQSNHDPTGGKVKAEAVAFVESWISLFQGQFPSEDQITSLATLTSLEDHTIRKIISKTLEDSASTPLVRAHISCNNQSIDPKSLKDSTEKDECDPLLLQKAASWLSQQPKKCPSSKTPRLPLSSTRIYQCGGCQRTFARKDLWKRHEEGRCPQEGWVCDIGTLTLVDKTSKCAYCETFQPDMNHFASSHSTQIVCRDKPLGRGKIFHDRDIFINHLKKIHPGTPVAKYVTRNHFKVQSAFEEKCNLCPCYPFRDWEDRIDHLANHFKADAKTPFDGSQFSDPIGLVQLQTDGLESIVGVESLLSSGLGFPHNSDLTLERKKEEEQMMAVNVRRQPSYTAPKKDRNQKNWEIGQSRHDEPWPYLSAETSDSFYRISDPSRATTGTTGQLPSTTKPIQTIILNYESEGTSKSTPSEKSRSNDSIFCYKPEAQVNPGRKKSLRENLIDARISKDDYHFFIPVDAIDRLICQEAIHDELSSLFGIDSELMNSVSCIRKDYQNVFGILTLIKKGHLISSFLQDKIKDTELPIRLQPASRDDTFFEIPKLESATGRILYVFEALTRWETDKFRQVQWLMIAPVFETSKNDIPHLELCDNVILPFIEDYSKDAREGGFSSVWAVRMHPAHQQLIKTQTEQEPLFAVKKLSSKSEELFSREVEMLKTLGKWKHKHILTLLATYRFKGHFHMIFLYAKHDLRSLWRTVEDPWQSPQYVVWAQKQMRGLAAGLYTIHENRASPVDLSDQRNGTSPRELDDVDGSCDHKWGRHGDIKAVNILCFADDTSALSTPGVLQIGDFGLGRFHSRQSRSLVMPGLFCTPTYAAPEVALGQRITRKYDMWSLGCLFLEFCTWLLEGPVGLDAFADSRRFVEADGFWTDAFYLIRPPEGGKGRTAHVKYAVIRWIERLQGNTRCSESIKILLALIRDHLLVVDFQQRVSAQELVRIFDQEIEKKDSDFTRFDGAIHTLRRNPCSEDVDEEPAKRQRLSEVQTCRSGLSQLTTSP